APPHRGSGTHRTRPTGRAEPRGDGGAAAVRDYDFVAIGAGSAAFAAAIRATSLGARVALVEKETVGGTCVNFGCIPSKHLLAASHTFWSAGHHAFAGVPTRQGEVDLKALVARKGDVVEELRQEKYVDLAARYGFELIHGHARFTGPDRVAVDGREVRARRFVIA